jgi:hypothetical protein
VQLRVGVDKLLGRILLYQDKPEMRGGWTLFQSVTGSNALTVKVLKAILVAHIQ